MRQIIRRLKTRTQAAVGLISIPMLGEDLTTEENDRVRLYNKGLKSIAAAEGASYIPAFERLSSMLGDLQGRPFRTSIPLTAEFLARRLFYNEGFDQFSIRKGYHFLIDGVHLNRRAAEVVASEIERFLRA